MQQRQRRAGSSSIPSRTILRQLDDPEFRDGFVADHVRVRLALLVKSLREERGWSQAELGRRLGKPQSVISRLEDPDYGRLSSQTIFEVAAAFGLPVYIDMPNWDEWFRLMEDMSSRNLSRRSFDSDHLATLANDNVASARAARSIRRIEAESIPAFPLDKYGNVLSAAVTTAPAELIANATTTRCAVPNMAHLINETVATVTELSAAPTQAALRFKEQAHHV